MARSADDAEPSIAEVLKQADTALRPPVKLQMQIASLKGVVSQKILSNGKLASRTEAVSPSQAVLISYDDANYEILPLCRLVIDKTQIEIDEYLKGRLRCNENALSFLPEVPPGFTVLSQEMESTERDGKSCYQIKTTYSAWILKASKNLDGLLQNGFPSVHLLIIDKSNMQPVELQSIAASGKILKKYEYLDISHPDDIPDDLFRLPDDFETKAPHDLDEYYTIHKKAWADVHPDRQRFWPPVYISKDRVTSPKTGKKSYGKGLEIGKTTVAQLEQTAEQLPKAVSPAIPQGRSRRSIALLSINLAIISVVIWLLVRSGRSKSEPH